MVAQEAVRYTLMPRQITPAKAARYMSLTLAQFNALLPRLLVRGYPDRDRDTGNYDLKLINAWMDQNEKRTANDNEPPRPGARTCRVFD